MSWISHLTSSQEIFPLKQSHIPSDRRRIARKCRSQLRKHKGMIAYLPHQPQASRRHDFEQIGWVFKR